MKTKVLIVLFILASCATAFAQSSVRQSGFVTPGHNAKWTTNGIIQDGGAGAGNGTVIGPATSTPGDFAVWGDTVGSVLADYPPSTAIDSVCSTNNDTLIRLSGTWQCAAYSAQFTVGSTLSIASVAWSLITSTPTTIAGYGITNARTQLSGNQNYYANGNSGSTATCGPAGISTCSAGSNSNDCLTPATACLTLQHVINLIIDSVDIAGNTVTVYLAHNAGTTNYAAACLAGPWVGQGVIAVKGDSGSQSATVVQDLNLGFGLQVKDLCTIELDYISFIDSASNNAAAHISVGDTGNAAHLDINGVTLNAINSPTGSQIKVGSLGSVYMIGNITMTGNAGFGIAVTGASAFFSAQSFTITVSGTPAYGTAFLYLLNGGQAAFTGSTVSGSATGPRCLVAGSMNIGGFNPNAIAAGNADCVANSYNGAIGLQTGSGGSSSFAYGTALTPLLSGGSSSANDMWGGGALQLSGVAFGSLPTPAIGMIAYVTDGKASNCGDTSCTTWGTTVTGGTGALHLFVWYNGTNWTLAGK